MSEIDPRAEEWAGTDEEDAEEAAPAGDEPGLEASEADAAEQSIDVDLDDDDYR